MGLKDFSTVPCDLVITVSLKNKNAKYVTIQQQKVLFLIMYYFISRYKELQTANPGQMPSITLSLFQSTGGRKFSTFITSFIRFVTKEFLNKVLFHSILYM